MLFRTHKKKINQKSCTLLLGLLIPFLFSVVSLAQPSESESNTFEYNDSRWIHKYIPTFDYKSDASRILAKFPSNFDFGVATAPAHVEDNLDDAWLEFAKQGGVAAYRNVSQPERRLDFFTNPEVEIKLAAEAGVKVFRLGVDWGRLTPKLPGSLQCSPRCASGIQDVKALDRYIEIIKLIKKHDMKVMLTLFHHSLPLWSIPDWSKGESTKQFGWLDDTMVDYFNEFTKDVIKYFGPHVDSIITFNEASIFSFLNHVAGIWPPANGQNGFALLNTPIFKGEFHRSLNNMINAHRMAFDTIKKHNRNMPVGIAHHASYAVARDGVFSNLAVFINNQNVNYKFPDEVADKVDFLGINYYGQENISASDFSLDPKLAYSESGRMINPNGLYETLKTFNYRYNGKRNLNISFYITENGISDETDLLRQPYLVEHLLAVSKAMEEGVPVDGYIFWTISDNWEWADGYCPKFGLVHVDRDDELKRYKRPTYHLFQHITQTRTISKNVRENAQQQVWKAQEARVNTDLKYYWDGKRPFCRGTDGVTSFDEPKRRSLIFKHKWWFNQIN